MLGEPHLVYHEWRPEGVSNLHSMIQQYKNKVNAFVALTFNPTPTTTPLKSIWVCYVNQFQGNKFSNWPTSFKYFYKDNKNTTKQEVCQILFAMKIHSLTPQPFTTSSSYLIYLPPKLRVQHNWKNPIHILTDTLGTLNCFNHSTPLPESCTSDWTTAP